MCLCQCFWRVERVCVCVCKYFGCVEPTVRVCVCVSKGFLCVEDTCVCVCLCVCVCVFANISGVLNERVRVWLNLRAYTHFWLHHASTCGNHGKTLPYLLSRVLCVSV